MSDDRSKRGDSDRRRIALGEEHEVRYWTKALGVSEDRLRAVVKRVGHDASAVRAELAGDGMIESPDGNMGPTGSGGVASQSPSPGDPPEK